MSLKTRLTIIKASTEPILAGAWMLLGSIIMASFAIHNMAYVGWLTVLAQFGVFFLIGIMFAKASDITAILALFGSLSYLCNQLLWNWELLPGQTGVIIYNETALWMTAIVNLILLLVAIYASYTTPTKTFSGLQMFPMIVILGGALWKAYLDAVICLQQNYITWAFSGLLWAGGMALMAFASILSIMIMTSSIEKTIFRILTIVGLLISSYGAIMYGMALSTI